MRTHLLAALSLAFLCPSAFAVEQDPQSAPDAIALYQEGFKQLKRIHEYSLRRAGAAAGDYPSDSPFWQRSPMGRMRRVLDLMSEAAEAGPIDWKFDWEEAGYDGMKTVPEVLPTLSRRTTTYHEALLNLEQTEHLPADTKAVLATARRFADGNLLLHYRQSLHSETTLIGFLAENASRLPKPVLRELQESLNTLPPLPTTRNAVDAEEAALRGQLWNLLAGVAKNTNGDLLPPTNDELRVSSMVALTPEDVSIGFESANGESFTLRLGQKRKGYKLVEVDLDEGRAILQKGDVVMVVELAARKVHDIAIETAWQNVERYLRGSGLLGPQMQQIIEENRRDKAQAFREILKSLEKDFAIIRSLWKTPIERMPDPEFSPGMSYVESTVPLYISTRRLEHRHRNQLELLDAALQYLQEPGPTPPSTEIGQAITWERQGGKVIFSTPGTKPGVPVTLEISTQHEDRGN